jgi:hypothetical protein
MWISHFSSFFATFLSYFFNAIGTSFLGFCLGVSFAAFTTLATLRRVEKLHGRDAMLKHWREDGRVALRVSLVCALIIYGPVAVWKLAQAVYDDHQGLVKKLSEFKKAPTGITAKINTVYNGNDETGQVFVWANMTYSNPLGPPSAMIDWKMSLVNTSGVYPASFPPMPDHPIVMNFVGKKDKAKLDSQEICPAATENPIQTGGSRTCWMWGVFKDKYPNDFKNIPTTLVITATDVATGHPIEVELVVKFSNSIDIFGIK